MADKLQLRLDQRGRAGLLDDLEQPTGEAHKSRRIDAALRTYAELVGGNAARPGRGLLDELLERAEEEGGLSAEELAEAFADVEHLPIVFEPASWSVGGEARAE